MIKLEDVMKACKHQISEGNEYLWDCFGTDVMALDFISDMSNKMSSTVSITFDTTDHVVYSIECWPEEGNAVFRWIRPDNLPEYKEEYVKRGLSYEEATDETDYVDVSDEETIMHLIELTINEEDCSMFENGDVIVNLNIENDILIKLTLDAHRRNITLNDLIVEILQNEICEQTRNLEEKK